MFDISKCHSDCEGCIRDYSKKHADDFRTEKVPKSFHIKCRGIPDDYVEHYRNKKTTEEELQEYEILLDPVKWAAKYLDWHCLDPDGSIWARKDPGEYAEWVQNNPGVSIYGKSRYHRPYQATMLRCSSNRKIFRIGRQAGKTETIVVSMLYHLFMRPGMPEDKGFRIVVIAPFQSQVELIFKRMKQLIARAPDYANEIASSKQSPQHYLKLKNDSEVIGFTAGTKSGAGAASARGQAANMLCFDEADYLSKDDVDAAMSIITNYPNASLWMSSTPTGKREKFFEACNNPRWKEFHFPSWINPLWNDELEQTFRETLTSLAWVHEVEAGFGEMAQGVFQHLYIDAAQDLYKYETCKPEKNWDYTIGVDWNDEENGTTIVVTGHNIHNHRYLVVGTATVKREGWTQLAACQEIQKLNRVWRPKFIYVDEGYGATQIELLKAIGFAALKDEARGPSHPDAKLINVVPFNFSANIEIRDPFPPYQITKKPKKGFMVENAVRFFENQIIRYPASDEVLTQQLQSYQAVTTPSGNKRFEKGPQGDHLLDALMLSLVAFALEEGAFGKLVLENEIHLTPPLNAALLEDQVARNTETINQIEGKSRADFGPKKYGDARDAIKTTTVYDLEMFEYDKILYNSRDLSRSKGYGSMRKARRANRPKSRSW
jgi:replicative DNA helicase